MTEEHDPAPEKGSSDELHARIDDVAASVKERASAAADMGARGAHRVADTAAGWAQRGSAAASGTRECTTDLYQRACSFVRERPVESIAIALAAGWLVGRALVPAQRGGTDEDRRS